MSALADNVPRIRDMREFDLCRITRIEDAIYTHPWTRGNFVDSISAGYDCKAMEVLGQVVGYGVQMIGAHESHLLNLSVAQTWQGNGYGRALLMHFIDLARQARALQMLLEVRPSNLVGRRLYSGMGFREIALRKAYYPAVQGREDAIVLALTL